MQLRPEYAAGQLEVSVAPADPVTTADLAVLVRETLRAESLRHGMPPVFAPVAAAGAVGNGRHLHTSLRHEGRNLCRNGDDAAGMTPTGEAFFAGVLPALMAIGAPCAARFDPAANPYLLTGCVIAAGLAGVHDALTLPAPVARAIRHDSTGRIGCRPR
ncbi:MULTISPECIES: hypothetical protein [unclassified Streptomyces]|uniref:hypothetical protein n=1 Tax=unclassified Streptomyces TaxID=2593676 RepID=UPI001EF08F0E|nr:MULTISPECIES: hypothetical protein [unclassified Streptomyces]